MIIGPDRTGLPGCSSWTACCCAAEKGRMPEAQLVELEQALLLQEALAEQKQER